MMRLIIGLICFSFSTSILAQDRLNILASASMFQDMAENIIGDKYDVGLIVPIGGDPHLYEPTPGDARKVVEADLILMNGLTFEGWINELVSNSGTKAPVATLTENITPISSTEYNNSSDPHAWMSAKNGLVYAANIFNAIVKLDPTNAAYYQERYRTYRAKILATHNDIIASIASIPEKNRFLITSHDAFAYYGKEYDIQVEGILGTSTEADAQTSDMVRVSALIENNNIPAIFVESTVNPKLIEQLAADRKVKVGGSLFADSLGEPGGPGDTYLKMLKYNTGVIVRALSVTEPATTDAPASSSGLPWWSYAVLGIGLLAILFLVARKL